MSDSSISSDQSTNTKTFESRQSEEKILQDRFQEQSEWYRLHGGTSLCDCSNCINARELKAHDVEESVRPRAPIVSLPKKPDIIPDIRSLFRFLRPADEAITTPHIYS